MRPIGPIVVPALLPATRRELEGRLAFFARFPSIRRVQIDVVDGHLASPVSWPYNVGHTTSHIEVRALTLPHREALEYEIDLMCLDPLAAASDWIAQGASRLTFHIESVLAAPELLQAVRHRYGEREVLSLGVALNVGTDLHVIEPFLPDLDYVQFMGIAKVGRQGERFDERALDQIRSFRSRHPQVSVQVDGGVTLPIAKRLLALGVSHLVVGSAILAAEDPIAALSAFEALQNSYGI